MREEEARRILVALRGYSLARPERRFVELVEEFINSKGTLTEEQESILKGIHREKKR